MTEQIPRNAKGYPSVGQLTTKTRYTRVTKRPIHPFARAIKQINSVYQEDSFEFITSMYKCHYVKSVYPFFVYYFDYVQKNEHSRKDMDDKGLVKTPLAYQTYDPIFLKYNGDN
uniref:Uncharacterized protein n=1 Tax=viral metagenome TaxID=1070528 RepID=A0A6C0IVM7_9ZZZZ